MWRRRLKLEKSLCLEGHLHFGIRYWGWVEEVRRLVVHIRVYSLALDGYGILNSWLDFLHSRFCAGGFEM